jgi:hypothetical protein
MTQGRVVRRRFARRAQTSRSSVPAAFASDPAIKACGRLVAVTAQFDEARHRGAPSVVYIRNETDATYVRPFL